MSNPAVLGLIDGVNEGVATGACPRTIIQGKFLEFNTQNPNVFNYPIHVFVDLFDTANGATATVVFQQSVDGATWTTWWSAVLSAATKLSNGQHKTGMINVPYFRANVTALAGTAPFLKSYVRLMG